MPLADPVLNMNPDPQYPGPRERRASRSESGENARGRDEPPAPIDEATPQGPARAGPEDKLAGDGRPRPSSHSQPQTAEDLLYRNPDDPVPVTAGLILSVLKGPRLEEVVAHYERNRDPGTQAASTHVLLEGLNHSELAILAVKLNEPVHGSFGQLLKRLMARC